MSSSLVHDIIQALDIRVRPSIKKQHLDSEDENEALTQQARPLVSKLLQSTKSTLEA